MLVVDGAKSDKPWEKVIFNIRVDDHTDPIAELARLLNVQRAYRLMNEGDELLAKKEFEAAMQKYSSTQKFAPHIDEIPFWIAVTLADTGQLENALPIFTRIFKINPGWAELVKRLPKAGLLREDEEMMKKFWRQKQNNMKNHLVEPNDKVELAHIDPNDCGKWEGEKEEAKAFLAELTQRLDKLQGLLYAEHKHKVLIVLQGLDGAGKDGTIRAVFEGVNPQGVRVANFKVPTLTELEHDYLWRIHAQVPAKGELAIFNRSHYEDVLVVRVHNLAPEETWKKRFNQIVEFERLLIEEGTTIFKFFLHIDREEQKTRFLERLDEPTKQWKFNPKDIEERKLWDQYMQAYEDVLNKTSTDFAPWYIIPSNHNWYRNMAIAEIIVNGLENLKMKYPSLNGDIDQYKQALNKT